MYVNLRQVLTRRKTLCKHGLDWGTPKCSRFFEALMMLSLQNITRLHSSMMRTARLLIISPSMHCTGGGVCSQWGCLLRGCRSQGWGGYPSMHWGRPPLWTEFLTHASENITLPQTSFAGGNYHQSVITTWSQFIIWNGEVRQLNQSIEQMLNDSKCRVATLWQNFLVTSYIYRPQRSKVIFSQACVKNSVHRRACVAGGSMRGSGEGGHAWQRGRAWQEKRHLQRTVRILLEYILVWHKIRKSTIANQQGYNLLLTL